MVDVNEPRPGEAYNPNLRRNAPIDDAQFIPKQDITPPKKKTSFFSGVGNALKDTPQKLVKGTETVGSGIAKTYRGIGRANAVHRARVLSKEDYKARRLAYKLQQQQAKEFLPSKAR